LQKSLLCRLKGKTKKSFPTSQKLNLPTQLADRQQQTDEESPLPTCGFVTMGY
jgi:hypothetical protein